jgi:hypothetical protein
MQVLLLTEEAQRIFADPAQRFEFEKIVRRAEVGVPQLVDVAQAKELGLGIAGPQDIGLAVEENGDLVPCWLSATYANNIPPDVIVGFVYSVRAGGLVRWETGSPAFTLCEAKRILPKLKARWPNLTWGPWFMPGMNWGYAQG